MTAGILWMVGNFASFGFVSIIFKISNEVLPGENSSCLDFAPCQTKEWDLNSGVGKVIYLYVAMVAGFLLFYKCEFRWSNFKNQTEKEDELIPK